MQLQCFVVVTRLACQANTRRNWWGYRGCDDQEGCTGHAGCGGSPGHAGIRIAYTVSCSLSMKSMGRALFNRASKSIGFSVVKCLLSMCCGKWRSVSAWICSRNEYTLSVISVTSPRCRTAGNRFQSGLIYFQSIQTLVVTG